MDTRILQKRNGCRGIVNGKEVIIFSSNDYLGLSCHPKVIEAAVKAAEKYGSGTGGAPGTTGTTDLHLDLSRAVAEFKSRDTAVLFPSGYQANIAIHHALSGENIVFHIDKRHHPSAVDGALLGKKNEISFFDHNRLEDLEADLEKYREKTNIVSLPSVFTVDGDIAPLERLSLLKEKYRFILILDEAHATGTIGKSGGGLEEYFDLRGTADFIMGSFSKALGSQGGFIAYNEEKGSLLKSKFRQFEYSTSLSAVSAAAALEALRILDSDPDLYEALHSSKSRILKECAKEGIKIISRESMIMLIPCENIDRANECLLNDGFFAVQTKSIFDNRSLQCLRITPMAVHDAGDIEFFAKSLKNHIRQS